MQPISGAPKYKQDKRGMQREKSVPIHVSLVTGQSQQVNSRSNSVCVCVHARGWGGEREGEREEGEREGEREEEGGRD